MSLKLTASNVLHHAKHALESGPARSTAISTTAGAVGLVAGKREDAKKVPIAAIAVGALAKVGRFHTIGDGLMAGGATLIGYKVGAKMARKSRPVSPEMPRMPGRTAPVAHRGAPAHAGHKRG
jgi:hypothetical protein